MGESTDVAVKSDVRAISLRKEQAAKVAVILQEPITYKVIFAEGTPVRQEPDEQSELVATLPKGSRVSGYCGQEWLRIDTRSPLDKDLPDTPVDTHGKWAFIGARLRASCLTITVKETFAEAVKVAWQGITCGQMWRVSYGLKWRCLPTEGGGGSDAALVPKHDINLRPEGLISGLASGVSLSFAVVTALTLPGGGRPQKVHGPWSPPVTCQPLEVSVLSAPDACLDIQGKMRGGCPESGCIGWIREPRGKTAYTNADEDGRCARCGSTSSRHKMKAELFVSLDTMEGELLWPNRARYIILSQAIVVYEWPCELGKVIDTLPRRQQVSGIKWGNWLRVPWLSSGKTSRTGMYWIPFCSADGKAHLKPYLALPSDPLSEGLPETSLAAEANAGVLDDYPIILCVYGSVYGDKVSEILCKFPRFEKTEDYLMYIANIASYITSGRNEFQEFRTQVLSVMKMWAALPGWDEESVFRPAFRFLDAIRADRPCLPALGDFVRALFAEHARQHWGPTKDGTLVLCFNSASARLMTLLTGACPKAKVLHVYCDPRLHPGANAAATHQKKLMAWLDDIETMLSWSLGNMSRYMKVDFGDLLRRPKHHFKGIHRWLGVDENTIEDSVTGRRAGDARAFLERHSNEEPMPQYPDELQRAWSSWDGRVEAAMGHLGPTGDQNAEPDEPAEPEPRGQEVESAPRPATDRPDMPAEEQPARPAEEQPASLAKAVPADAPKTVAPEAGAPEASNANGPTDEQPARPAEAEAASQALEQLSSLAGAALADAPKAGAQEAGAAERPAKEQPARPSQRPTATPADERPAARVSFALPDTPEDDTQEASNADGSAEEQPARPAEEQPAKAAERGAFSMLASAAAANASKAGAQEGNAEVDPLDEGKTVEGPRRPSPLDADEQAPNGFERWGLDRFDAVTLQLRQRRRTTGETTAGTAGRLMLFTPPSSRASSKQMPDSKVGQRAGPSAELARILDRRRARAEPEADEQGREG